MKEKLINLIADKHEKEALKLVDEMLAQGVDPQQILDAGKEAMVIVGKRFEDQRITIFPANSRQQTKRNRTSLAVDEVNENQ